MKISSTCLLLLLCLLCAESALSCEFPEYLTQRSKWESKITLNRRSTGLYLRFKEEIMGTVNLENLEADTTIYTCSLELPGQKFLVYKELEDLKFFQCYQFLQRSNQIIQVRESSLALEGSFEAEELCADSSLVLNPWPLIWSGESETYHSCPMNGGFEFHMIDNMDNDVLCQHSSLKPRVESECMTGEGMTFDFRNFECRGNLEMEIKQTVLCLGTWTDEEFTYSVLTDDDDLWPKLWLLRFQTDRDNSFRGRIYNDIMVETRTESSEKFFELHFEQAYYPTLCENEAHPCLDCTKNNAFYCQKTCHSCDELEEAGTCEFDGTSQGEWTEHSHKGERDVYVTSSMMYADDLLPLRCYDLHTEGWFEDKNYKTVATVFKNGCKPRYTCVEFKRVSSAVLLYRISQNLVWPQKMVLTAQDVCADEQFRDDDNPLSGKLRSKDLKPLIHKRTGTQHLSMVPCGFSGKFLTEAHLNKANTSCTAYIDGCASSYSFTVTMGQECSEAITEESHRCLASFDVDGTQMIVTDAGDDDYFCWAFYKEEWDSAYRLYLLQASDCHSEIGRQIRYYNHKEFIAAFYVNSGSGDFGSHSCGVDFPELTTASTSTSESTTSTSSSIPTRASDVLIQTSKSPSPPLVYTPTTTLESTEIPRTTRRYDFTTKYVERLPTTKSWTTWKPKTTQASARKTTKSSKNSQLPKSGPQGNFNQYHPIAAALSSRSESSALKYRFSVLSLSLQVPVLLNFLYQ